ncbi:MAG: hypothetical protein ACYTGW_22520 [Planctomycetota bacterium]
MKRQLIYGLGLLLAAPLCAQAKMIYSPQNLATTEGQYYSYYFLRYSASRFQNVDGENRGKAASITHVSMRLDNRSYSTSTGQGRSWSNLTVKVSEGDLDTFSNTFASNAKSTPTTVFNNAWKVPAVTGTPLLKPAVWGGLKNEYTIAFSTAWVYTGKADILTDWQYSGGKMDNGAAWTGSRGYSYYLDGYGNGDTGSISRTLKYIPSTRLNNNSTGVTGRCNDSAQTRTSGSYVYVNAWVYGNNYSNRGWANKLRFYQYSYYTAFDAPVLHGITFENDPAGVDMGTGCNKLHVKGPMVVVPMTTFPSQINNSGYTGYAETFVPWEPGLANLKATVQGAWTDSKTSAFNLTQAAEVTLPPAAPVPLPKRMANYNYNGTSTTGSTTSSYVYNPVFAYTTK